MSYGIESGGKSYFLEAGGRIEARRLEAQRLIKHPVSRMMQDELRKLAREEKIKGGSDRFKDVILSFTDPKNASGPINYAAFWGMNVSEVDESSKTGILRPKKFSWLSISTGLVRDEENGRSGVSIISDKGNLVFWDKGADVDSLGLKRGLTQALETPMLYEYIGGDDFPFKQGRVEVELNPQRK